MTHQCCVACRLRFSPASGAQACPRCDGALEALAAEQLVGYSLLAPTDTPAAMPVAVSQALLPPRLP